jgi:hypothetical protein
MIWFWHIISNSRTFGLDSKIEFSSTCTIQTFQDWRLYRCEVLQLIEIGNCMHTKFYNYLKLIKTLVIHLEVVPIQSLKWFFSRFWSMFWSSKRLVSLSNSCVDSIERMAYQLQITRTLRNIIFCDNFNISTNNMISVEDGKVLQYIYLGI